MASHNALYILCIQHNNVVLSINPRLYKVNPNLSKEGQIHFVWRANQVKSICIGIHYNDGNNKMTSQGHTR